MKRPQELPRELVWTAEGHLSDVAMTAIADGEEAILPRDAFAHLGMCEGCATGVESAASLSIAVSRALSSPANAEAPAAARAQLPFPVWAVALAIAVGATATLPNLGPMRAWLQRMWWGLRELLPFLTRQAASLVPRAWNWLPVVSLTAAMLLLIAGLSVARLAPRAVER